MSTKKDIFSVFENAGESFLEQLPETPFLSESEKKRMFAKSLKTMEGISTSTAEECSEDTVQGVERYNRPVWHRALLTAAACIAVMAGAAGTVMLMHPPAGRGDVPELPPEIFTPSVVSASTGGQPVTTVTSGAAGVRTETTVAAPADTLPASSPETSTYTAVTPAGTTTPPRTTTALAEFRAAVTAAVTSAAATEPAPDTAAQTPENADPPPAEAGFTDEGSVQQVSGNSVLAQLNYVGLCWISGRGLELPQGISAGDLIRITYDGIYAESFPMQITNAYSIEIIGHTTPVSNEDYSFGVKEYGVEVINGSGSVIQVLDADTTAMLNLLEWDGFPTADIDLGTMPYSKDYDFDSYSDLFIPEAIGVLNTSGRYFRFVPETGLYEEWPEMNKLELFANANADNRTIEYYARGSAVDHENRTYQWQNGQLVLIDRSLMYRGSDGEIYIDVFTYSDGEEKLVSHTNYNDLT